MTEGVRLRPPLTDTTPAVPLTDGPYLRSGLTDVRLLGSLTIAAPVLLLLESSLRLFSNWQKPSGDPAGSTVSQAHRRWAVRQPRPQVRGVRQ